VQAIDGIVRPDHRGSRLRIEAETRAGGQDELHKQPFQTRKQSEYLINKIVLGSHAAEEWQEHPGQFWPAFRGLKL